MSNDRTRQPEPRYPEFEPLAETVQRVFDAIAHRTGEPEFPTGIRFLDSGFGLARQNLVTIAARPGQGKSSLAAQIAYALAQREHRVAYFSLEMTKESLVERMFCQQYAVSGFDLLMGAVSPTVTTSAERFTAEITYLPLRIIDDYCFTERQLYTLIEHLEFRPDVVIVDHLQHIRATERSSAYETYTEYLRYLKELSRRHKFLCLVISQINRQGNDLPSLATLKGTGAIEEMSDLVYLLHDDADLALDAVGQNFNVHLAKNRFGPTGLLRAYFRPSTYRFFDAVHDAKNPNHDAR